MFNHFKTQINFQRERRRLLLRSRRRGAAMLIMALAVVFLCGCASLAVDYGLLVSDKDKSQRGVDAAALAGAQELKATGDDAADTAKARSVAVRVAAQNGVTVNSAQITFLDENTKIRVPAANTRQLYFARVIGIQTGTVNSFAIASAAPGNVTPAGGGNLAPIGITKATYELYAPGGVPKPGLGNRAEILFIDHKKQAFGTNNFILFDLRSVDNNAKSPTHMVSQLIGEEKVEVRIGSQTNGVDVDFVDALNAGSSGSKFMGGMRTRFLLAAGSPWFDLPASAPSDVLNYAGQNYDKVIAGTEPTNGAAPFPQNPRLMDLIITDPMEARGGSTNSPVLDFAPVYVESVMPVTNGLKMTVRFLSRDSGATGSSGRSKGVSLIE